MARARVPAQAIYCILYYYHTQHTHPSWGTVHFILETHLCQAYVLQPTCSFNNKTSYISQKCPLCLVMATTRPRDHCAMAARPPTRAADPSSAPLRPSTWFLLLMATTWFGDFSAAAPPRPSTWFRDPSAATPPRPHLRVVPLLVDKVVGDIAILKGIKSLGWTEFSVLCVPMIPQQLAAGPA
jgi:hypothetical protein